MRKKYFGSPRSKCFDAPKVYTAKNSKAFLIYHYRYFNHGFKFQNLICNGCHNLMMLRLNLSDIIITDKSIDSRCIIHDINKSDEIHLLENSILDLRGYI